MIKAVIFDLGNVLIHYDAVRAAKRFSREAKIPLLKVWVHFFISRVEKAYTRGEITTREFFRHSKKALNSKISYSKFAKFWNEIFWENRGIRPVLRRLGRHYPIYLISNTNALHFNYVRRRFPQIFRYFKRTFPSHWVGHRKPDPRIYQKVLKAIRLRPEETVFIDDVPRFVRGAKKVGMKGIRFRSIPQLRRELGKLGVKA
jgi:putative hydrolase of the HAD superfamily